jgi:hypothetical protein
MKAVSLPSLVGILASLDGGSMTTVTDSTALPAEESDSEPLAEEDAALQLQRMLPHAFCLLGLLGRRGIMAGWVQLD